MKKLFNWIKKHYIWSVIILIVLFFIVSKVFGGNGDNKVETITLAPQEFVRTVSVAGKVTPADDVELGFETTGRIAAVYKKEGDKVYAGETLAVLSSGDVSADVMQAQADLAAEQARLNELQNNSGGTVLQNSERELYETISNSYTAADDAIRNHADRLYNDGSVSSSVGDYDLRVELNRERRDLEYLLKKWKDRLDMITVETFIDTDIILADTNVRIIKAFLDKLAIGVNEMQEVDSPYTEAEIDAIKTDISNTRTDIAGIINDLIVAKDAVRDVESEIPYQEARVQSAQAVLKSKQSELGKRSISAPFTGVVTKLDAKVGEIVSANSIVMRLISDKAFTIETYVPEINISEVQIGDTAQVTLDAYGDDVLFEAKVVSLDPGETIRDGVSTYKVIFEFTADDERLKSGMTANIIITTEKKDGVLLIPQESVTRRNGFSYVQVKVGKETVEKQITVGAVASNGYVEVVSGLAEGEVLIKNVQ